MSITNKIRNALDAQLDDLESIVSEGDRIVMYIGKEAIELHVHKFQPIDRINMSMELKA